MHFLRTLSIFFALGGLTAAPAAAQWSLEAGWESQYISEGRRALDASGGLFSGVLVYEQDFWFAEAWNGVNHSADFWELDFSLGANFSWELLDFSAGYTMVKVWEKDNEAKPDHELFAGAAISLGERTIMGFDFVYADLANGWYGEWTLTQALPAPEGIDWSIFGAVAWDFGYASEAFDGLSHAHLGTEIGFEPAPDWSCACFLVVTIPFEDLERDGESSSANVGFSIGRGF